MFETQIESDSLSQFIACSIALSDFLFQGGAHLFCNLLPNKQCLSVRDKIVAFHSFQELTEGSEPLIISDSTKLRPAKLISDLILNMRT